MRCQSEAPSARLRSTYRRSLSVSTCARISRAVDGHDVIPMTRMMFWIDGPRTAASTIASGRNGITRNHSVRRISTASVQPPKKPAVIPTTEPMTHRQDRGGEADEQADARAPDELRQHAAPEVVGAQRAELRRVAPTPGCRSC